MIPATPVLPLIFGRDPDIVFPVPTHLAWQSRDSYGFEALVRLKTGVSMSAAEAELQTKAQHLRDSYPRDNRDFNPTLIPLKRAILGRAERLLWFLFLAAGVVWLIVVIDLGAFIAIRIEERHRELAIRCALGASLRHLASAILREVATVTAAGAGAGVLAAWMGIALIKMDVAGFDIPRLAEVNLSATAVIVGISASVAAGIVGTVINLGRIAELHSGSQPSLAAAQRYLRPHQSTQAIVVMQFSLALVLTNAAALAGRSLVQTQNRTVGYNPRSILAMQVWITRSGGDTNGSDSQQRYQSIIDLAQHLPHVDAVTACYPRPTTKEFLTNFYLPSHGLTTRANTHLPGPIPAVRRDTAANYFRAMAVPLLRGRLFLPFEGSASDAVIVNSSFVNSYSHDIEPIGRLLSWTYTGSERQYRIVGVVADSLASVLDEGAQPTVYFPGFRNVSDVLVRTDNPSAVVPLLRKLIHHVDSGASVLRIEMLEDAIQGPLSGYKIQAWLSGVFAALAVLLTAAGLYGNVRYAGEIRLQEYGIRLALGATEGHLTRMRLQQAGRVALKGLALGALGAIACSRLLRATMFGVPMLDPLVLAAVGASLMTVALVAAYASIRARSGIEISDIIRLS